MRILTKFVAGSLLSIGVVSSQAFAAPLSHSQLAVDSTASTVEQIQYRGRGWDNDWGDRGRHYGWRRGRHYGWYGPPPPRRYGYYGPRYRSYGYYRPARPRAGVYFGFGAPGYW